MNYPLVGAFVLVLGGVLVAAVLWLASGGAWQKKYDLYLAIEDESVAGLNLNAPVKYNGVTVGAVKDIQLDSQNPERVRLIFKIEQGTPIKQDTLAVLKTQGLTGIAYVELSGGAADAAPLQATAGEPYPVIRTKPSLSARLENVLTGVLEKLDRTSSNIDAVLSKENQAALSSTLADIAAVAHTLAARKDRIDSSLVAAAKTFDNTARASQQFAPLIERMGRSADAFERMSQAVEAAGTHAGSTLDRVDAGAQGFSRETLPELQRLLGELEGLTASLRRLSEQLGRDPASLLRGPGPVPLGPGESITPEAGR